MRAIIDTNCLLASIPPLSKHYWLYQAFVSEKFEWAVSTEIMLEYAEKLTERYSKNTADLVLNILSIAPNTVFAEPFYRWKLIANDPDDDKFVDLYIATNADYLVSHDSDFKILAKTDFPKVSVVSLEEFKTLLVKTEDKPDK